MEIDKIPQWLLALEQEDVTFLKNFVLKSGSLKEIAKLYEVSFSSLLGKDLAEVSTTDQYPSTIYHFQEREWLVEVQSEPLGHVIERLTPYRQEIILLYFFLGFKNKEIAALYGCNAKNQLR